MNSGSHVRRLSESLLQQNACQPVAEESVGSTVCVGEQGTSQPGATRVSCCNFVPCVRL